MSHLGVPYRYLILVTMATAIIGGFIHLLSGAVLWGLLMILGRYFYQTYGHQYYRVIWIWFTQCPPILNRRLWRMNSYDPD